MRVHSLNVAIAEITKLKFELLLHPLYWPDLASNDYSLFPNLKWLGGQQFESNKKVVDAVSSYCEELDVWLHKDNITKLEHQYEKFISLSGDNIEKLNQNFFFKCCFYC